MGKHRSLNEILERGLCEACGFLAKEPYTHLTNDGQIRYRRWCFTCRRTVYRRYKKKKCEKCNFEAKHLCQLDVDHIDGNHNNNDPENLQTLCANCHRLKSYLNNEGWCKEKR